MASIKSDDYESIIDWVMNQSAFLGSESHELITINALRNLIFDAKLIYTGFASKAAINLHNGNITKMTKEHFNPRQKMAEKIVAGVKLRYSKEVLLEMLLDACKINYTTKAENDALKPYQKREDYVPAEAYKKLNIELILHKGGKKGKTPSKINIDGVTYTSANEVAEYFGCSAAAVYQRVNSQSKKWSNWNYVSNYDL
jgi:hypothetical protein